MLALAADSFKVFLIRASDMFVVSTTYAAVITKNTQLHQRLQI